MSRNILLLVQTRAPVTHSAGNVGNVATANRVAINGPHGPLHIPFISGNSIRHQIRAAAYNWLRGRIGLSGRLSLAQLNLLLHGGSIAKGANAGGFEDTRLISAVADVMPMLSLLGGCLPSQTLTGALISGLGYPVCEETRAILPPAIRELLPDTLPSCSELLSVAQYTRGDALASHVNDMSDEALDDDPTAGTQMIMSVEVMNPNTWLVFELGLNRRVPDQVEGCLVHAIAAWTSKGGILGGMSGKGHGRTDVTLAEGWTPEEQERLIAAYVDHVDRHAEQSRDWLDAIYTAPGRTKPGKAKAAKGKSAKAAETDVAEEVNE